MWISRVRVTGGFLNGLDVPFAKGLNVIIGARGAGKTTLLELIRHAIGAKHADDRMAKSHQEFLKAILGSGDVILDLETDDGGRHLVVDAKGGGQRPDLSNAVLVLGQNELESIASDAPSRLNLLDLRAGASVSLPDRSRTSDITATLFELREELEILSEEMSKRETLMANRDELAAREAALLGGNSDQLSTKREQLRGKEDELLRSTSELHGISSAIQLLTEVITAQTQQGERLHELLRQVSSLSQVATAREQVQKAASRSKELLEIAAPIQSVFDAAVERTQERNLQLRTESAPIRASLEEAESGLGQITSQLRNIDSELQLLLEKEIRITQIKERYESLVTERSSLLDEVEKAEEELYELRAELARETTGQIASNVVIAVDHFADSREFRDTLQSELRGSNTRSSLIDEVADRVLPRQLLELIEAADSSGLASAADIAPDRAERLLQNLNKISSLRALSQTSLKDSVDFRLTDGQTEKSVDTLSTGQKCAVTLPVILSEKSRTLILDQPEDHLDNAYLVRHVVTGMENRNEAQTIVATHNANIPVLGSANQVLVLESDGKNGHVAADGPFDRDSIVDWITGLMEGGREAFAQRVEFYSTHGGN